MSEGRRRASRAVSVLGYPLVVLGALAGSWALLEAHVAPGLVSIASYVIALVTVALLERLVPYRAAWTPRSFADARQDLGYLGLAAAVKPLAAVLGRGLVVGLAVVIAPLLARAGSFVALRPPMWVRVSLALAATDLVKYALHRASHESAFLFRFHEEHHAPEGVHVLNATRLHPVNTLWNLVPDLAFPLAFGVDGHALVLVAAFQAAVSVLQHANVSLTTGPLDWLLSTPSVHRFHHARDPAFGHANYGSTFLVWDVLFGTRHVPRRLGSDVDVGLEPKPELPSRPRRLFEQLVWPFCAARATCRFVRARTIPSR